MGKLPGFTFYPGDWLKDPELRRCSKAAKGVWIDMLCLMFECPVRGVLAGGEPWSDQEIASAIGGDIGSNLECIAELVSKGVAQRDSRGAIFNRRMVRDEQTRQATRERVARFRSNGSCNASSNGSVTPMYCNEDEEERDVDVGSKKQNLTNLELIYLAYPRKVGKGVAIQAIQKALARLSQGEAGVPFDELRDAAKWLRDRTEAFARSPAGQRGEYTPHPSTWFNQKRYLDDESEWHANGDKGLSKAEQRTQRNRETLVTTLREMRAEAAGSGGSDSGKGTV